MIRIPTSTCQIFLWTSVKTLSMHQVGPHGAPTHFEGQTIPEVSIPLISTIFVCSSKLFFGWSRFRRQKCQIFFGRTSRPCLCMRLAFTALLTHFERQTSPEASIPLILMIFVCSRKPFFGWFGFRRQKSQIFLWTSVKNFFYVSGLPSRPIRPILKFKRAPNHPYSPFWWFSCTIAYYFFGYPYSDVKTVEIFGKRPLWP